MGLKELVINLDDGPNSSGRRTQFIKRMFEDKVFFAKKNFILEPNFQIGTNWRFAWFTIPLITVNTILLKDAGEDWKSTGMEKFWGV